MLYCNCIAMNLATKAKIPHLHWREMVIYQNDDTYWLANWETIHFIMQILTYRLSIVQIRLTSIFITNICYMIVMWLYKWKSNSICTVWSDSTQFDTQCDDSSKNDISRRTRVELSYFFYILQTLEFRVKI